MKTCNKCHEEKEETEFNWENKATGKLSKRCKVCQRKLGNKHYSENKSCYKARARRDKIAKRKMIWRYLSNHPCIDCGEKDPIVLEFDHDDMSSKINNISDYTNMGIKQLEKEIEKCTIRCANCHRRKTAKQLGYYKEIIGV